MSKLINAGFSRLFKSRIFWVCVIAMAAISAVSIIDRSIRDPMDFEGNNHLLFYGENAILIYAAAIFVGAFSGAEHSGGIRNKLIIGHNRVTMYFSELIVCSCGVGIMQAAHVVGVIIPACVVGGGISFKEGTLLGELMIFALLVGLSALFLTFTLLIPKKVVGAVIALILIIGANYLNQALSERIMQLENGIRAGQVYEAGTEEYEHMNDAPSEQELAEAERLKEIKTAFPFGQITAINKHYDYLMTDEQLISIGLDPDNEHTLSERSRVSLPFTGAGCSLAAYMAATAAAIMIFRKKDIR